MFVIMDCFFSVTLLFGGRILAGATEYWYFPLQMNRRRGGGGREIGLRESRGTSSPGQRLSRFFLVHLDVKAGRQNGRREVLAHTFVARVLPSERPAPRNRALSTPPPRNSVPFLGPTHSAHVLTPHHNDIIAQIREHPDAEGGGEAGQPRGRKGAKGERGRARGGGPPAERAQQHRGEAAGRDSLA